VTCIRLFYRYKLSITILIQFFPLLKCIYFFWHPGTIIPRSTHAVYLCVLCGSQNKQRLFPYTALTDWSYSREEVCLLRGTD